MGVGTGGAGRRLAASHAANSEGACSSTAVSGRKLSERDPIVISSITCAMAGSLWAIAGGFCSSWARSNHVSAPGSSLFCGAIGFKLERAAGTGGSGAGFGSTGRAATGGVAATAGLDAGTAAGGAGRLCSGRFSSGRLSCGGAFSVGSGRKSPQAKPPLTQPARTDRCFKGACQLLTSSGQPANKDTRQLCANSRPEQVQQTTCADAFMNPRRA